MKNKILSFILAVLCILTAIPFTAFHVSAAEYTRRTLAPASISGFEDPWASDGNYKIQGMNLEVTEFDGVPVKAFSKSADAEKITAYREKDGKYNENYGLNLYNYAQFNDSDGKPVRVYDAAYVSVEYYYDTANRDETDEFGSDFTENNIIFVSHCNFVNNEKISKDYTVGCTDKIVANEWATAVMNVGAAFGADHPEWYEAPNDSFRLGQWKIYPFGNKNGLQMYRGDVFYIKSITFTSVDTSNLDLTKVYYSADGAIEGVAEPVYSSMENAVKLIADNGGVGTIIVDGDWKPATGSANAFNFSACSELTIKGYDSEASATFCSDNSLFFNGDNTQIVFDNIKIARGDGSNDENWLVLRGIDLTFGSDCTFEQGTRTYTNSNGETVTQKVNLYIAQGNGSTKGYSVTVDSDEIKTSQFAPMGGYTGSSVNISGDYSININAGTHSEVFGTNRNGNKKTANKSKITGNSSITVNGGTITKLATAGSCSGCDLTGNSVVTLNGGKFTAVRFGDDSLSTADTVLSTSVGGMALIVNAKAFGENGYALPSDTVIKDGIAVQTEKSAFVVNNAEIYAENGVTLPKLTTPKYRLYVNGGSAAPVLSGDTVKFSVTSDNPALAYVVVNDEIVKPDSDGYYTFAEGETEISFNASENAHKLTYKNGDATITGGRIDAGTDIQLSENLVSENGRFISGYKYGETVYGANDIFTMPDEDVVIEIIWKDVIDNARFVSASGADKGSGYTPTSAFATIAYAVQSLGGQDGKIVIMDDINQYFNTAAFGDSQSVVITGKDPYTEEIYDAVIRRQSDGARPPVSKGHLTLEYIGDYHSFTSDNNRPFIVGGNAHLTIGEGYKFYNKGSDGNKNLSSQQINIVNAANPVVDINERVQLLQLMDYGTSTISGDVNINIGPNASFDGNVIIGGDSGSALNCTVNGQIYVTVNGSRCGKTIYLGGSKNTSNTTINGIQVILNETNMTVQNHPTATSETFKNNGAEYIVKAEAVPEGGAVEQSGEFGKVNVTIPEGYAIVVTDSEGSKQTYESSGIIGLPEGNSVISFVSDNVITLKFDDGTIKEYNGGETVIFPAGTASEGKLFYAWRMNGKAYFPGDELVLVDVSGEYDVTSIYADANSSVYIDMANGNDGSDGLSAESALKTASRAEKALSVFKNTATLEIVGDYICDGTNGYAIPNYSGTLTVKGGVIVSAEIINIRNSIIFKEVSFKLLKTSKHIQLNGQNAVFESTVKTAEGSKELNVHAGRSNSDMNGDQKLEIYGGNFASVQMGPYYIPNAQTRTWNGNFELILGGSAAVNELTFGDGYGDVRGGFDMNGKVTAVVESGASLGKVNPKGYAASYDSFRVYNYSGKSVTLGGDIENRNFKAYSFFGIVPASIDGETMTFDSAAHIENPVINTDDSFTLALPEASGCYTIRAGISVADGLTIDGAQIRIANGDVKQGLRFIATYKDETAAKYEGKEYGYVVIPTAVLNGERLDATKTYTFNNKTFVPAVVPSEILYAEGDGFVKYTVCLLGIEAENYKTSYTVITYIKDGDSYIYGDTYAASVYDIANAAVAQHNDGTKPLEDDVLAVMQQIISEADAVEGGAN